MDIDAKDMYDIIDQTDLKYGQLFRGLEGIKFGLGHDTAIASLSPPHTEEAMPYQTETDLVIHPVTLDICLQASWTILNKAGTLRDEMYVPTYIKNLEIAANISNKGNAKLRILACRSLDATLSNQQSTDLYVERKDEADDAFACQAEKLTVASLGKDDILQQEVPLAF